MSYATVAEADSMLSHSAAWLGLDEESKRNHLATATLWLNFSYEWPGCVASCGIAPEGGHQGLPYSLPFTLSPAEAIDSARPEWPRVDCCAGGPVKDSDGCVISGVPRAIKAAEVKAALANMTVPLFGQPAMASDGGLTKKLIKAGPITVERQWAEPTRASEGQLVLADVDAILYKIATRRGVKTGRPVLFM